jgi:hypothetical protein
MRLRPALVCHLLCLGVLRCASLLVPGRQRAEWWKEWRSELWHVRQACIPDRCFSWSAEQEVAAFCLGAFEDARCLMKHGRPKRVPLATTMGSATQCILLLTVLAAISYGVTLLLPGVSALTHPPRYRDARSLMLIQQLGQASDSTPTISAAQYQTWRRRRQELFDGFAFYKVVKEPALNDSHRQVAGTIAYASSNLFELLGLQVRFASASGATGGDVPRLILSDQVWKKDFGADPQISGRTVRVGSHDAVVIGVAPEGAWRLPGRVNAWLLEPDTDNVPAGVGYVVAHLKSSAEHAQWSENWHMSAPTPDGTPADFFCSSLKDRTRRPWDVFLFAVMLACLALPATTSIPLGEYRLSSRKLSWSTRLRRWSFLGAKIALILPIANFVSLSLAHIHTSVDPITSQYVQIVSAFSICLFGLRWTLRDQRQRCPVCLGKLTHPARVGQPSRSFLAWNGTELICIGGHGLLHVPEMATSWFSTQRWLYLDPSWEILFPESGLASASYF